MATVPQPSTFAHSKEDVLNALSFYFGEPVSPEKLRDYGEHQAATYHFPDAYAGSNTRKLSTVEQLMTTLVKHTTSYGSFSMLLICRAP